MGRDIFHQTRMLRAPSHQDLNLSRDATATFFGVFFVLQNWKTKDLVDAQLQTGLYIHLLGLRHIQITQIQTRFP